MMYDLAIVGGGPGGVAAGIYAARKKLNTVLITDTFGGQSLVSADVQNWIGTKSASGYELAKMFEEHLRAQDGIEILDGQLVQKIDPVRGRPPAVGGTASAASGRLTSNGVEAQKDGSFKLETNQGKVLNARVVLLTLGSRRKKLGVPGEDKFEGRGVAYCSICDAPLFGEKAVAVVGGGNAGLEAVIDLLPYASKIYLLHRNEALKGDLTTQEKIKTNPKVEIILNAETQEILGDETVTGLVYKDKTSGELKKMEVQGVFVEVGIKPNSEIVKDLVKLNERSEVIVDHKTQQTSQKGIWAAGDVTDGFYRQNNISAGDAIKAVLNIHDYLKK